MVSTFDQHFNLYASVIAIVRPFNPNCNGVKSQEIQSCHPFKWQGTHTIVCRHHVTQNSGTGLRGSEESLIVFAHGRYLSIAECICSLVVLNLDFCLTCCLMVQSLTIAEAMLMIVLLCLRRLTDSLICLNVLSPRLHLIFLCVVSMIVLALTGAHFSSLFGLQLQWSWSGVGVVSWHKWPAECRWWRCLLLGGDRASF